MRSISGGARCFGDAARACGVLRRGVTFWLETVAEHAECRIRFARDPRRPQVFAMCICRVSAFVRVSREHARVRRGSTLWSKCTVFAAAARSRPQKIQSWYTLLSWNAVAERLHTTNPQMCTRHVHACFAFPAPRAASNRKWYAFDDCAYLISGDARVLSDAHLEDAPAL